MSEALFEKLKLMNDGISEIKPQKWESLPDIDLYMDQVLKYMTRQGVEIDPTDSLTASMVSNYVKSGTMPGAHGKRYGREHIAYLTAIQTFKQVLSVKNTKELIDYNIKSDDTRSFYEEYLSLLSDALGKLDFASEADENVTAEQIGKLALKYAIASYSTKLVCERLLYLARSENDERQDPEKETKSVKVSKQEKKKKGNKASENDDKQELSNEKSALEEES